MINFKAVTEVNRAEVEGLSLLEFQEGFVESVSQCLNEADRNSIWHPKAIYVDETLIGFAMYGFFEKEGSQGRLWLDRYLIDQKYQGKGYGKAAVKALLVNMMLEFNQEEVFLSVYPDNISAIRLYESIGFKFNGEKDINGEDVMYYKKNI